MILAAMLNIPTPLVLAWSLSAGGSPTYLKNETVLPTGSFKVRGALHSLTVNLAKRRIGEVVAASTGNHGAAVAWAARAAGCRATIFLPSNPNPVKAERIRALEARIVETGPDLTAAIEAAEQYSVEAQAFFLHDAADPDVPAGTATIGEEILVQQPAVDRLYVPMGDTALIRGVAAAVKRHRPATTIVGVVAANAPAYLLSWQHGQVCETSTAATIADGLAVRRPLAENVSAIRALVDEVRSVTEEELLAAIRHLRRHEQITAEPAGAAATAAYLQDPPASGCSVLLVTGGNIAPDVLARTE
jgi:threonine dehydratase